MNSSSITLFLGFLLTLYITGCSTLHETLASQTEVPTLENQANRVAISMTIIRENNLLAYHMPISSDALWIQQITADINATQKQKIAKLLMYDPYYATVNFSAPIQRKMLQTSALMDQLGDYGMMASMLLNRPVSPLTYEAIDKIIILYGTNTKNWPNIYNYENSLDNILDFKNGKLLPIESPSGDIYETLDAALISLTPINLQKDLMFAKEEMLYAYDDVSSAQLTKGELDTKIKLHESNNTTHHLSYAQLQSTKSELQRVDTELENLEKIADEKERIYFTLLDDAIVALENDLDLDDVQKEFLAKNIYAVADEIQDSSYEAYVLFGLALANILANDLILNLPTELESLAYAKIAVPFRLQHKYNERLLRLAKNSLYILPNVFMGTYYAYKQSSLAQKYKDVTQIIIEAYAIKHAQEKLARKNND